jgi:hypothetical protein
MKMFEAGAKGAKGLETAAHGAAGGIHAITGALAPLGAALAVLAGVGSIFAAFKESIEAASRFETAKFNFEGIAGGADNARGAIAKLKEIGHETATGFGELSGASKLLIEAGMSADAAADATGRLQKIALNTGGDLNELAEIYARITIKQEISQKDLAKLAMSGIPGVAAIAAQFKELERATTDANKAIEANQAELERTFELNEKNVSGITSFTNRIGLTKDAFDAFSRTGRVASAVNADLGWGFGKITNTLQGQFADGLKQISDETGVSQKSLMDFAREGKLGYEDLIQAAGRYRKEQEEKAKQANEAEKLANENRLLEAQRGLVGQIGALINQATDPGGMFATVNAFFETWKGKLQELNHAIGAVFKDFGTPLMEALKPALDYLTQQTPAIQKLATDAGNALGDAIRWFIDSLKDGTFWDQVKEKGAAAFTAAMQPVNEFGAKIAQGLSGLNKNNELIEGLKSLSKILDAVADGFGIKLLDSISRAAAELDVTTRERISQLPGMLNIPGVLGPIKAEEKDLTHAQRVELAQKEITPTKADRELADREWQEGTEGIQTHFPAAMRQGVEAFQTSPDIARSHREFDQDVAAGRPPYFVKPEMAARDYEKATGQKQPEWMSPQTAERIAQLLEAQNAILRQVLTAGGAT